MSEHHVVDARGSFCPGPLMELIAVLKRVAVGDTLELLSSDQGSAKDVPEWVRKVGHEMGRTEQDHAKIWHVFVKKSK